MEQCVTSFPEQSHREIVWVGGIFFEIFSDGCVLPAGLSLKLFSTYFSIQGSLFLIVKKGHVCRVTGPYLLS